LLDVVRVNNLDMRSNYEYGDAVLIQKSLYDLQAGDVIYFRYPIMDSMMTRVSFVQRVYGLPGDTFEIKQSQVYLNRAQIIDTIGIRQNYFIKTQCKLDSLSLRELGLVEGGPVSDSYDYSFSLTEQQVRAAKKVGDIKSIDARIEKTGRYDENCFPFDSHYAWNADNYGPLRIPKKNDTLAIDTANIALYSSVIRDHEKNHLEIRSDSIFINSEYCHYYVVKKNYYFVLGDNRGNANDSRTWGFLPENMIIGKVIRSIRKN
jgi:signal peptidase I